jgi:hypothetical protein
MSELRCALSRELLDLRAAPGRLDGLLAAEVPVHDLAAALVQLGQVNESVGAVVDRLAGVAFRPDGAA